MDKIIIGCDGGCRGNQFDENIGGWGVVLRYKEHEKKLKGGERNTTNNRMELIACIKAMEAVIKKEAPTEIYTDSAYLHNCLTQKWYIKWEKNNWRNSQKKAVENKDLWIRVLELMRSFKDIKFFKSQGHSGEEINELADGLANEAMDELQ